MLEQRSGKRIKTDKRDAELISKCLAQHNYSSVNSFVMSMSPHHYVNVINESDNVIKKAEELIDMVKRNDSPIKPSYSHICSELGGIKNNLNKAVAGLTKDSKEKSKYIERLDKVDKLLENFKNMELNE